MTAPTVSVFVPAYNSAAHLSETLVSLLGQTFGDFELIVADDGSSDETAEIAESFAARDRRVRVLRLRHAGEVAARNAAIAASHPQSRFLLNHDSDDISLPAKLERLVGFLRWRPWIHIVGCFARYFDDSGREFDGPTLESRSARIRAGFADANHMINSAALIRRSVFTRLGGYREALRTVDDYDFFARALLAGFRLANIPEVLHLIRIHAGSVSRTRSEHQARLAFEVRNAYARGRAAGE